MTSAVSQFFAQGLQGVAPGGALPTRQLLTASGTITPRAGLYLVRLQAPGEGGARAAASSTSGTKGGNAGHFYQEVKYYDGATAITYTIGAAGLGATVTATPGGVAGNVVFDNMIAYGGGSTQGVGTRTGSVAGGVGGAVQVGSSAPGISGNNAGFDTGTASNGVAGGATSTFGPGGSAGGSSQFGLGGAGGAGAATGGATASNGVTATGYGGGGGGGGASSTGTSGNGGNGAPGFVELVYLACRGI